MAIIRKRHDTTAQKRETVLTTEQLRKKQRNVTWERRFQSVMITVTVAGIIWGIQTLAQVDKTQGMVVQRLDLVEIRQAAFIERRESARDYSDVNKRIDLTDRTLVVIDGRLKVIEDTAKRKKNK